MSDTEPRNSAKQKDCRTHIGALMAGALGAAALAPLVIPDTILSAAAAQNVLVVGAAVLLILVVLWRHLFRACPLPRSVLLAIGAAILVLSGVSAAAGGAFAHTAFGFAFEPSSFVGLFALFASALCGSVYAFKRQDFSVFHAVFFGGLAAVIASSAVFLLLGTYTNVQLSLPVGSPLNLAVLSSLVVVAAALMLDSYPAKIFERIAAYCALFVALGSLFLVPFELARTLTLIFLFAGTCVFLGARMGAVLRKKESPLRMPWHTFVAFLVVVTLPASLLGSFIPGEALSELRISWSATGHALSELASFEIKDVLIGTGPNTFPELWEAAKPDNFNTTPLWNVRMHYAVGFIPTHALTIGFLGVTLWLIGVAYFYLQTLYAIRRSVARGDMRMLGLLVAGLLGITWSVLFVPSVLVLSILFAVVGISLGVHAKEELLLRARVQSRFARLGAGALLLVGGAFAYYLGSSVLSLSAYEAGVAAFREERDLEKAAVSIERAQELREHDAYARSLVEVYQEQFTHLLEQEPSAATDREFAQIAQKAIESGERAVGLNPRNYLNWLALGGVYERLALLGIEGSLDRGFESYGRAAVLAPHNPVPHFVRGRLFMLGGKPEDAAGLFENALRLKPDFAEAQELLEQVQ